MNHFIGATEMFGGVTSNFNVVQMILGFRHEIIPLLSNDGFFVLKTALSSSVIVCQKSADLPDMKSYDVSRRKPIALKFTVFLLYV